MIYLICQDWANTSNNHAGMKYLCNTLAERYPTYYKSIVFKSYKWTFMTLPRGIRKIQSIIAKILHKKAETRILKQLSTQLTQGDKVYIMEYMEMLFPMLEFAKEIKKINCSINVYAMVHLVPSKLEKMFGDDELFKEWIGAVDKIMTLGSSLTSYFIKKGVDPSKIVTTFHYVDLEYYNYKQIAEKKEFVVIAMGNQMRNLKLLKQVVANNPDTKFYICQGVVHMEKDFVNNKNVTLIPFVAENQLRAYMNQSDVSLNIMEDTIGSNVIVTSMAMGLAMICSDVGSVRDYCSENNCIFVNENTALSYSHAIAELFQNPQKLEFMKKNSRQRALMYSIERFHNEISVL